MGLSHSVDLTKHDINTDKCYKEQFYKKKLELEELRKCVWTRFVCYKHKALRFYNKKLSSELSCVIEIGNYGRRHSLNIHYVLGFVCEFCDPFATDEQDPTYKERLFKVQKYINALQDFSKIIVKYEAMLAEDINRTQQHAFVNFFECIKIAIEKQYCINLDDVD